MAYIPNRRSSWTFQQQSDLVSSNNLLCLEICSTAHSFLIFNIYNNVDNSAVKAMKTLSNLLPCTLFLGDFNLHHPIWSRNDNLNKHPNEADELVQLFSDNSYGILN